MKIIILFISLISFTIVHSQIVNIPDPVFKNFLLTHNNPVIDTNGDNEIQISEASAYSYDFNYYLPLTDTTEFIRDLTGIEEFVNIKSISFYNISLSDQSNLNITNFNDLEYIDITITRGDTNNINIDLSNNPILNTVRFSLTTDNGPRNSNILNLNLINSNNISILDVNEFNIPSLSLNNLTNLTELYCSSNNLNTLDVSNNNSLIRLYCANNYLNEINLNNHPDLKIFDCSENSLNNLDISNTPTLTNLVCVNATLETLDLSNNSDLNHLNCANNLLTTLDVSANNIDYFRCENNIDLVYINLKNVLSETLPMSYYQSNFYLENLPNLQSVCVLNLNTNLTTHIIDEVNHSVTFMTDCNFELQTNTIQGTVNLDLDNNGCDINDISLHNVLVTANNGINTFGTFILDDASYSLFVNEGNFNTNVTTNLPTYFTTSPNYQTNTFTGFDNTFTADFCITPNQTVNDVNVIIIPTSQARPGFNSTYQIIYKNVGTTQLSGNVTLEFNNAKLDFLNANQTVNTQTSNLLTFDYTNLNPFETRTIDLEFNVFTPPIVEINHTLNFTATINPIASDFTTDDNVFTLNQTVIGSYDPNDITCLEGNEILLEDADKYLHYLIRFQNTGTASAINVVVTNDLDANLDWSTLQLESLSHNNRVTIKNGNKIEFIFENINLPDSTTDEPNSHGFIAYKIKPKSDITLGDIIPNKADIFFDFNAPIETNIATTTIVNTLSVNENTLLDFSVFPTLTENILNVKSKTEIIKIEIYSKLGQKIIETTENQIDISNLTQGLYFVKVEDVNGKFGVIKIVKK